MGRPVFWGAACAVLALGAGAITAGGTDRVLLIGGTTVWRAQEAALVPWGCAVLIACALSAAVALRHGAEPRSAREVAVLALLLVAVLGSGAWTLGAWAVAEGGDLLYGVRFTVLRPAGSACAVVVEESATLRSTEVRLYPIDRWGIGAPAGDARGNEPSRPVSRGEAVLVMHGGSGTLRLGDKGGFVPETLPVACPTG